MKKIKFGIALPKRNFYLNVPTSWLDCSLYVYGCVFYYNVALVGLVFNITFLTPPYIVFDRRNNVCHKPDIFIWFNTNYEPELKGELLNKPQPYTAYHLLLLFSFSWSQKYSAPNEVESSYSSSYIIAILLRLANMMKRRSAKIETFKFQIRKKSY